MCYSTLFIADKIVSDPPLHRSHKMRCGKYTKLGALYMKCRKVYSTAVEVYILTNF
jgi:hypothetical protein